MSPPALRRMRLSMLGLVNRHADVRGSISRSLDVLRAWQGSEDAILGRPSFCVTIDGERLDDAMLALVRPVIERELAARVSSIDEDLEALGVSVE